LILAVELGALFDDWLWVRLSTEYGIDLPRGGLPPRQRYELINGFKLLGAARRLGRIDFTFHAADGS
jgi:hypothetical protein